MKLKHADKVIGEGGENCAEFIYSILFLLSTREGGGEGRKWGGEKEKKDKFWLLLSDEDPLIYGRSPDSCMTLNEEI